jgi:hypothetical protein
MTAQIFGLAEFDASGSRCLQCSFGTGGNHLPFRLSDYGHQSDDHLVGFGHVGRYEANASFLEAKQEMSVTG